MIHFITGKPGGGKSLYSTMQVIEELRTSNRFVTTNLRLNLQELEVYMQNQFGAYLNGEPGESWTSRVRLLDDVESKHFWLHPAPGCTLTDRVKGGEVGKDGVRELDVPDWNQFPSVAEFGTLYLIDELHDHFNAREWQKSSKDGIYWASKHRHLRQDALLITQHPELVDKNFRRLAQDFTVLRNFGNEPMLGFRFANRFRRATYLHQKGPGDRQPPTESGWFKLDKRVASCYFTHGTTGILSRTDVKESKGRGRHPAWIVVFLVAFMAVLWYAPGLLTSGFTWSIQKLLGGKKEMVENVVTQVAPAAASSGVFSQQEKPAPVVAPVEPMLSSTTRVSRVSIMGSDRVYHLTDGSVLRTPDKRIIRAGEDYVQLKNGQIISR